MGPGRKLVSNPFPCQTAVGNERCPRTAQGVPCRGALPSNTKEAAEGGAGHACLMTPDDLSGRKNLLLKLESKFKNKNKPLTKEKLFHHRGVCG